MPHSWVRRGRHLGRAVPLYLKTNKNSGGRDHAGRARCGGLTPHQGKEVAQVSSGRPEDLKPPVRCRSFALSQMAADGHTHTRARGGVISTLAAQWLNFNPSEL